MNILYDTKIDIHTSLHSIWQALITPDQRLMWQNGIKEAHHISGDSGYRGALTKLQLNESDNSIVERVKRSRPLERLHLQFDLGDCSYEQIYYLSRLDETDTRITYHCKQNLQLGWRKILHIQPTVPAFLHPDNFASLNAHLTSPTKSTGQTSALAQL